jgi:predicted Zn-dependent peptidase
MQSIILYGLPEDYYERYIGNLAAVTPADVVRAAGATLDTSGMAALVVADAGKTRGVLGSLGRGPVVELDSGGERLR